MPNNNNDHDDGGEARGAHRARRSLIVGGSIVNDPAAFPAFAWTGIGPGEGWGCGGSLIHPDIVLTAGHCVWVAQDVRGFYVGATVAVGANANETNGEFIPVDQIVKHPGGQDILLAKLQRASTAPPVQWNTDPTVPAAGTTVRVVGFGVTETGALSEQLRQVEVQVSSNQVCRATWGSEHPMNVSLCAGTTAGGKDACDSDSGSPLFIQGADDGRLVQVGIVGDGKGCGISGVPALYTRVSSFSEWMESTICNMTDYPSPAHCGDATTASSSSSQPSLLETSSMQVAKNRFSSSTESFVASVTGHDQRMTTFSIFLVVGLVSSLVAIQWSRRRRRRRDGYRDIPSSHEENLSL